MTISQLIETAYENWDNPKLLTSIGAELETRSRLNSARKILMRAIELAPLEHDEAYLSLAFAFFRDVAAPIGEGEKVLGDGIDNTDSDYLKALYCAFIDNSQVAEEMLSEAKHVDIPEVQIAVAYAYLWRGFPAEALPLLRSAISGFSPDSTLPRGMDLYCGAMNWLAGIRHEIPSNEPEIDLQTEVEPFLEALLRTYPETYSYYALKIQMFQILKDWNHVIDSCLATLSIFPDEETTMVALGTAYDKLGNTSEATHYYSRAIGAKPNYIRARVLLGNIWLREGKQTLAEQIMREIPNAFPEYGMGRIELAYFLEKIGNSAEADSVFKAGYEILRPHEKGVVETNPQAQGLLQRYNRLTLNVL